MQIIFLIFFNCINANANKENIKEIDRKNKPNEYQAAKTLIFCIV